MLYDIICVISVIIGFVTFILWKTDDEGEASFAKYIWMPCLLYIALFAQSKYVASVENSPEITENLPLIVIQNSNQNTYFQYVPGKLGNYNVCTMHMRLYYADVTFTEYYYKEGFRGALWYPAKCEYVANKLKK